MKKSILVLVVFALISCKEKDRSAQIVAQLNPTDTFLFEFPKFKGVLDSSLYRRKNYNEFHLCKSEN